MTELLNREKEFLKLNDQLNKMANNHVASPRNSKLEERNYGTYQKSTGISTLLKKKGAGDAVPDVVITDMSSTPRGTARQYHTFTRNCDTSTTPQSSNVSTQNRKPPTSRTLTRPSNNRTTSNSHGGTFTVKYRNPKFVESPSLEVLIRDECTSIRDQCSNAEISSRSTNHQPFVSGSDESSINSSTFSKRMPVSSNGGAVPRKNVSSDGLIKFLKSKITILEEDHDRLSQEMNKQKDLLDKALERSKLVEQQRDQAYAKNTSLTDQLAKIEIQLDEASRRLKERSTDQLKQQKELETVKRELKILTQNNNNLEKRLFNANEELEKARNALAAMKNSERELKESKRMDIEIKDKQIKSLKKQRSDLLNAYKKQLFLIDNLKRQNICMEQSKMIAFGEKEFAKILEWNMKP